MEPIIVEIRFFVQLGGLSNFIGSALDQEAIYGKKSTGVGPNLDITPV
jgi:hypothetical protein